MRNIFRESETKDLKATLQSKRDAIATKKNISKESLEELVSKRISATEVKELFDNEIEELLVNLREFRIIPQDFNPSFGIGSTRLAAQISGKEVNLLPSEDLETIEKAAQSKTFFGSIDVDIKLEDGKTLQDVVSVLEAINKEKELPVFEYELQTGKIECVLVSGNQKDANGSKTSVVNINIIDITEDESYIMFQQSTSIKDISEGVLGHFQNVLFSSVLKVAHIDTVKQEEITNAINTNKEVSDKVSEGYSVRNSGRFMFCKSGIKIVVDLDKEGEEKSETVNIIDNIYDMNKKSLDDLARVVLQDPNATCDDIFSAYNLSVYLRQTKPRLVPIVWSTFIEKLSKNLTAKKEDTIESLTALGNAMGMASGHIESGINNVLVANELKMNESFIRKIRMVFKGE